MLKLTVDMETGERGYLVTATKVSPAVSGSLEGDRIRIPEVVPHGCGSLFAADPAQKLHENLHHWQGYAEQMIALRRAGGAYADLEESGRERGIG